MIKTIDKENLRIVCKYEESLKYWAKKYLNYLQTTYYKHILQP